MINSPQTHTYIGTLRSAVMAASNACLLQTKSLTLGMFVLGMFLIPAHSHAQVTLSGTVFSDAGLTAQAVSKTIKVAVGTSTPSVFSTTSSVTTGAWTVTIPVGHGISTSTPILVWIDNDVSTRGQVLTKSNSSQSAFSITGLNIYKDRVIARHEATSGTSTTLADFSFYTAANDSDVQHSTSTGQLTIASGNELYIWAGKTFAPGSNVTVLANATASSTDGSMYLALTSVYTAGGTLTLGGSLTAVSTATFNGGFFTTIFNATTTGKVINAPIPSIGNITFDGAGGAWTFTNPATTSALALLKGTVVAPTTTLGVTGTFQNDATFTQTGGTINIVGASTVALGDIALLANGLDVSGSAGGIISQNITSFAVSGNTLYVGQAGSATGCSQTAGSAQGCELLVFNVASTSNPVFVAGRDSSGSAAGTSTMSVASLLVQGTTLYVAKTASGAGCSQTEGLAAGCELIVFSIASTTNPIFAGGRDADGTLAGTTNLAATGLAISGNALYMTKTLSGTTNCSTTASNCELLVFNIASTTNPLYVYGLDASGSNTGTLSVAINAVSVVGNALYVVKAGLGTACSQTAGSAQGCELMVFSIASTTLPVYTRGVDVNGSQTGTGNLAISTLLATGTTLYLGTAASSSVCSQTTGSVEGCELQVYNIASTTNPIFTRGVDVAGSYTGRQALGVTNFALSKNYLYVTKAGNATLCAQTAGFALGCELMIFDVASTSAMRLIAARDADGTGAGVTATAGNAVVAIGESVILGKAAAGTTACSTTRLNCELIIFSASTTPRGLLYGVMNSTSALGNVTLSGSVEFKDTASVTNLTIAAGTTTAPSLLTVAGNYTNNAIFQANEGTMLFASTAAQTLSGTLTGTSSLYRAVFSGSGTKTFSNNASSSFVEIQAGASVVAPTQLTVADTLTNNGNYTANDGTLSTNGFLNGFLSGLSAGGNATDTQGLAFNAFAQKNNTVYIAKAGSATPCAQTAGSAVGCELLVVNVASTTNPVFVAGRDVDGSTTGSGNVAILHLAIAGNSLYVAKAAAGTTACSNTAGAGATACELMVFDISSTTNPIYTAGRDTTGSNAGTSTLAINQLFVSGSVLYAAKAGSSTACSQTVGLAGGCELMVFDVSSTSNPVFAAGRDADGSAAGVTIISGTSFALASNTLYMGKQAAGAACTTVGFCELMIFDIASTTNPLVRAGIDASGNNAGAQSVNINSIAVSGTALYVAKAGGGTTCSATAGSTGAASCELMVFDISSTTNPIYRAGVDAGGATNSGTQNLALNSLTATGTVVYVAKAGSATACSQVAGLAVGCELMVLDISSTTNPAYIAGRDSSGLFAGSSALTIQTVFTDLDTIYVGKALDTTVCELEIGLRTGCELLMFKSLTTVSGTLSGSSALSSVTTNGLTQFTSTASVANLIIASSSIFTAPTSTLSIRSNFTNRGAFAHNNGTVALSGNNVNVVSSATATFYDLTQIATTTATTTFSTGAPFIVANALVLSGASSTVLLNLRSATPGVQWQIDVQGPTVLVNLNVQNSNNISTNRILVCGSGCIDAGNNINWELGSQLEIAGVLYLSDGITPVATSTTIKLVIGGEVVTTKQAATASTSGAYSFTLSDSLVQNATPYMVFADNSASIKGTTVTVSAGGQSIDDMNVYSNHLIIRNENNNSSTTNAHLAFYTSVDDADARYSLVGNNLTVATNTALLVLDNTNFTPGGSVTIPSAGTGASYDGSLQVLGGATYTAGGDTTIAGSLTVGSSATYVPGDYVTMFTATSTGKTINVQSTNNIGNVTFDGTGAWTVNRSTEVNDFKIDAGTVTVPSKESSPITINGVFQNYGTFNGDGGSIVMNGSVNELQDEILNYLAGRDGSGSAAGTLTGGISSFNILGNYLYIAKGANSTPCSQVAGSATGCELQVYDISSSTNPVYVAGRDSSGNATGTSVRTMYQHVISGNYLYSGNNSTLGLACSEIAGFADGCELQVYDISSSTNPVYVAGRDTSGSSNGTQGGNGFNQIYSLAIKSNYLFAGKESDSPACSQVAGSAIGCELMVFDISSSTNPIYIAGRDTSGSLAGTDANDIWSLYVNDSNLYVGKGGNTTPCSQTAGSAQGCELMVFDISSSTNPIYIAGRDGSGSDTGTINDQINSFYIISNVMYVGKSGSTTACSQVAGSASGCELMIFDISSTTNPTYIAGRDSSGNASGTGSGLITSLITLGKNTLFVGKLGNTTPCSQTAGSAQGCELMVFDISSSTNPIYIAGRDGSGSDTGTINDQINSFYIISNVMYVGKSGSTTACSQVAGSASGCELQIYSINQPGIIQGNLTSTNNLSAITINGYVDIRDNASTSKITINSNSVLELPNQLTLGGNLTNNGRLNAPYQNTLYVDSTIDQTLSGNLIGSSSLQNIVFNDSELFIDTKTFASNASVADLTITNNARVVFPEQLTVRGDFVNENVFNAQDKEVVFAPELQEYVAGRDISGNSFGSSSVLIRSAVVSGSYLFIGTLGSTTPCSQTAGSAIGCELQVYDISSSSNPIYVAGRDSSGSNSGTANEGIYSLTTNSNQLFVGLGQNATACSQVAGSAQGCELMVFDISSTTNPTYVAGRDASGSASGTTVEIVSSLVVSGSILYLGKGGDSTACSQVAGSAIGCELMVFDISSTTNPTYVAGRDSSGSNTGTETNNSIDSLGILNNMLYVGKFGASAPCSQTAGSADGCELMVFDISSTTNPTYVAGRDASGSATGSFNEQITSLDISKNYLYLGKSGDSTACSQVAGSAIGCELMVFDISSTTNPTYVAGRDLSGDADGISNNITDSVITVGNFVYLTKSGFSGSGCSQIAGLASACELQVYDISSSSNPIYVAGRDSSGSPSGIGANGMGFLSRSNTMLYVVNGGNVTPCSQTAGSAQGCELMVFDIGSELSGSLTGSNDFHTITARGPVQFNAAASTTNLTIESNSTVIAPATTLSLSGNFTNQGSFTANGGTVALIGTDQTISSVGTTTFFNLTQTPNETAHTRFSNTGAFVTTGALTLRGTNTAPLLLRSTTEGAQWTILPLGTSSVSWLDVQDSRNASTTNIVCTNGCLNSGNNLNWTFSSSTPGSGSSTLAQHTAGQVSNVFSSQAVTDGSLLGFRLTPNSGSAAVTNITIQLVGLESITDTDFTNLRIVRDHNSNKLFDGGDEVVSTGVMGVTGKSGTITFSDIFTATTSLNYLVVTDIAAQPNGSFMGVTIVASGVAANDITGSQRIFSFDNIRVQHSRNNKGGGGGSSSVGGAAPAGDGDVGGGDTTGGELIGEDPDFFWPANDSGSWGGAANAYDRNDGTYATASSAINHSYSNHGFAIPTTNTVGGIEVKLELSGTTAAGSVNVQLSWDGGASWTSSKTTPTLTTADSVRVLGSGSDLWGRTWTPAEFSNANFAVRVAGSPSSNTIRLDAIQVKVYHVSTGGGAGGGGGSGGI